MPQKEPENQKEFPFPSESPENQKALSQPNKELNALKRACLYSIPPNRLGYCGPKESWKTLQEFISNPAEQKTQETRFILQNFNALYPYLQLIAEANALKPFSPQVIEAYWLGSPLLENISFKSIQKTILSFQKHGLPSSTAEKKASQLPESILSHHSMHVLYINFISRKIPALVQNLSDCLIQWGKVQASLPEGILTKGIELFSESGQLKLKEKEKILQNPFGIGLEENDLVTVHWNSVVEKITKKRLKSLQKTTFNNLRVVNS